MLHVDAFIWYTDYMKEFIRNSMALLIKSEQYPDTLWYDLHPDQIEDVYAKADSILSNHEDDTKDVRPDT